MQMVKKLIVLISDVFSNANPDASYLHFFYDLLRLASLTCNLNFKHSLVGNDYYTAKKAEKST